MAESVRRKAAWVAALVAAAGVVALSLSQLEPEPVDPAVAAETAAINEGAAVARYVKAGLKNPPSFELVAAAAQEDGSLCLTYRATNSFGGIVTERAMRPKRGQEVWRAGAHEDFDRHWREYCSAPGRDITRLVRRFM